MMERVLSKRVFVVTFVAVIASIPNQLRAAAPSQWNSRGPGGGGALFAPSFNPYSAGELYLACDMSEVFHTTNYGTTWNVVDFRQMQGNRQAIAQFTSNPLVIYAIDFTGDLMTPTKSSDG